MKVAQFIYLLFFSFSVGAVECDLSHPLKTSKPEFAKKFSINYFKNFKIVYVDKNRYVLSRTSDIGCEIELPKIITPVKKAVMMSTTYLPALELLKQEKSLIAFPGKRYIVSKAFHQESVQELSSTLNAEYLLKLKPDLIMYYNANLSTPDQLKILQSLKIPVVLNVDFEETTPLARAEWLIFISAFYDQEDMAKKILNKN